MIFANRQEAGKRLASELAQYGSASSPRGRNEDPIIVALPRGGVPIGFEIAEILHAPLEVIVARKIGASHNPEFGIGAIAEGNVRVLDEPIVNLLAISKEELEEAISIEKEELKRRVALYRNNKPLPSFKNRTIILVDDGLATGVTARAAIAGVMKQKPKRLMFASPVCAYDTAREFQHLVDNVICVTTPVDFVAVGLCYRSFAQVSDEEVVALLEQSRLRERPKATVVKKAMRGKLVVGAHHAEPESYMHHRGR